MERDDGTPVTRGKADRSIRRAFTGSPGTALMAILLAALLACPAGAFFYMNPVGRAVKVGEVVTLSGSNSENRTTYLFVTGPYLDNEGAMLTNTSALAIDGSFDSVPVSANYSWSFVWNTSLPGVSLTDGNYVVYASVVPRPRFRLTGYTYTTQTMNFQGRLPVETSNITPTPTPIPAWTPPPEGTVVRASSGPSDDYPGRFDGDLIVYEARRGEGDSDIYLYNITSGNTTEVASGRAVQRSPAISGKTIVYSAFEASLINRTDADLYTYDVASGVTRRIPLPGDQLSPRIQGDLLAWQDEAPGRSSVAVYLYDLGTQVKQKVPARTWAYSPDLSGGKVTWIDDPVAPAVYLYDIVGGTVRKITNRTGIKGTPALSGERISWADTRTDYEEIYVLDLATGAEKQVTTDESNHFTPAISGDLVAWVDFRNGNRDIYAYDLAVRREIEVVTGYGAQIAPQVAGCTVAWADDRNGSYDVYYRKLSGCTPAQTPAPVSLQPEITSTPSPVTSPPTPVTTSPTTVVTTQATPVPTTKSPGFWVIPALGAAAVVCILVGRIRGR